MDATYIKHNIRRCAALAGVAAVCALCFVLGGCSYTTEFTLTTDGITLTVGETRDIMPYVRFLPETSDDKTVALSSDSECVAVSGTVVYAVACGRAQVTVGSASGSEVLDITVEYRAASELALSASDTAVQTVTGKPSPIVFELETNDFADPYAPVEWEVDGERVEADGRTFTFSPLGHGEYEIVAHAYGLTAHMTVKVYRPTTVSVAVDGALEQSGDFSAVKFTAAERVDTRNPASVFEWRVNGTVFSTSPIFEFVPRAAGEYEIRLTVNGEEKKIGGKDSATVTVVGARAPLGEVSFDDAGGGVSVAWSDGEHIVRVSVVSPNGSRRNFDRSDAQYAYRFGRGYFDATDVIEVCAQDPAEYTIVLAAQAVREFKFMQYPLAAREYLENVPFISNTFVSSVDDGVALIDELYACGVGGVRCYLGRDADGAVNAMLERCELYGMSATVETNGAVVTFAFADRVNAPTEYEPVPSVTRMYSELPHIEYTAENRRAQSYSFAIERASKSVVVEGSEQLLTAVMRGVRPLPTAGSTAAVQYSSARGKLLGIIGASYTDAQKVHAIYDWLQWVTICSIADDRTFASGYTESVFGSAEIGRGDARRAVVTSAGAAKAFALLCGIEGIKTVFQTTERDGASYVWNKVCIDGLWYNIDVYGGKASSAELNIARRSEFSTHRTLFMTDDGARRFGLEPDGGEIAAFDTSLNDYLQKRKSGGVYYDRYVDNTESSDYSLIKAAVYDGFASARLGNVSVPVVGGTETYVCNTLGAELALDQTLDDKTALAVCSALYKAADEYAKEFYGKSFSENAVRVYRINNIVHLTAVAPNGSADATN